MDDNDNRKRIVKIARVPEGLRVLWLFTKNSTGRERKRHINSLPITFSSELRVANPLTWSLPSLALLLCLHLRKDPLDQLIKFFQIVK
jgi:hypothetical protein